MLFARAMSNGVRWFCPDVFSGNTVYTPDELGAETDDNGVIVVDGSTGEIIEEHKPSPKAPPPPAAQHRTPTPQPAAATNGNGNGHKAPVEPPPSIESLDDVSESPFGADVVSTELEVQAAAIIAEHKLTAPPKTQAWAVQAGYCANEHEARNSWKKIVDQSFGGRMDLVTMPKVVQAYVVHQLEKKVEPVAA
jgi:hypothetical protein